MGAVQADNHVGTFECVSKYIISTFCPALVPKAGLSTVVAVTTAEVRFVPETGTLSDSSVSSVISSAKICSDMMGVCVDADDAGAEALAMGHR